MEKEENNSKNGAARGQLDTFVIPLFPYGINREMDRHAHGVGLGHWSCVSPQSNEWWVRVDGKGWKVKFLNGQGYSEELREFDQQHPMAKEKPSLGLKPKFINDMQRSYEIMEAISRYVDGRKRVPIEWMDELHDLVCSG